MFWCTWLRRVVDDDGGGSFLRLACWKVRDVLSRWMFFRRRCRTPLIDGKIFGYLGPYARPHRACYRRLPSGFLDRSASSTAFQTLPAHLLCIRHPVSLSRQASLSGDVHTSIDLLCGWSAERGSLWSISIWVVEAQWIRTERHLICCSHTALSLICKHQNLFHLTASSPSCLPPPL